MIPFILIAAPITSSVDIISLFSTLDEVIEPSAEVEASPLCLSLISSRSQNTPPKWEANAAAISLGIYTVSIYEYFIWIRFYRIFSLLNVRFIFASDKSVLSFLVNFEQCRHHKQIQWN